MYTFEATYNFDSEIMQDYYSYHVHIIHIFIKF